MHERAERFSVPRASLTRRRLLRTTILVGGGVLAGSLLAACGQQGTGAGAGSASPSAGGASASPSPSSTAAPSPAATTASSPAVATATGAPSAAGTSAAGATPTGGALGNAATATLQPSGGVGYTAHTDVKGAITFWHFWGSSIRHNAIRRVINSFMQKYPGIKVTDLALPFGDIWTKNLAAVASGSGMPDVLVTNRPTLRFEAKNNIYQSLQQMIDRDKIDTSLFWPFTWTQSVLNNQAYGLPYETDIRVLYYNKAAYADAGLDHDKPAANWDDLWSYSGKLDQKNGSKLERVGFFPIDVGSMGLDTWNWNNGGEWQDSNDNPTVNAPPNVETAVWIKKWIDRYGWSN